MIILNEIRVQEKDNFFTNYKWQFRHESLSLLTSHHFVAIHLPIVMKMIFNSRYYFRIQRLSIIETTQRGNPFFKFLMFEPY